MPTEEELHDGFSLGACEIHYSRGVILRDGEEVRPEPQTWRVLICLAKRNGGLVSKEDLVDEVWGGRAVADDPINRAIAQARKAIGDTRPPTYIETLQRRGYRLMQPVELHQPVTEKVPVAAPAGAGPGNKTWWRVGALILVGLAASILLLIYPPWSKPVRSIAVMPFANLGGSEAENYIASGFSTELVASLAAIDGLMVKNCRRCEVLDDDLEVERALYGTVRINDQELVVNYEIVSTKDDGIVSAGEVTGSAAALHALQEELAMRVAADLGGQRQQQLLKTQPTDSAAFDSYMRGIYELENRGDRDNLAEAVELFQESIEKDEHYGPAYLGLATTYALMVDYFDAPVAELNALALQTIEDGVRADPSIADAAGSVRGFVAHKEKDWETAERAHLRAVNAELVDANAFNWYSRMLASVGRYDDALVQAQRAVEIEPSNAIANSRLAIMHTWLGNDELAAEYFARASELGAGGVNHLMANAFLMVRNGRLEEAQAVTAYAVRLVGAQDDWIGPVFDALADPALADTAIASLNEGDSARAIPPQASLTARTILGDLDGAMRVAELLKQPGEIFEIELLFIPEHGALWSHPDFDPLLDSLNITGYWKQRGCEWDDGEVECAALVD